MLLSGKNVRFVINKLFGNCGPTLYSTSSLYMYISNLWSICFNNRKNQLFKYKCQQNCWTFKSHKYYLSAFHHFVIQSFSSSFNIFCYFIIDFRNLWIGVSCSIVTVYSDLKWSPGCLVIIFLSFFFGWK